MEKLAEENCFVDEDTKLTSDDDVLSYVEFGVYEHLKYTEEFSRQKKQTALSKAVCVISNRKELSSSSS